VIADRTDRVALSRLVNDLEQIPNPEGSSGGGLSPRLEAELIKMLTRPAQRELTPPFERLQIAAVFGLLGAIVGALGVAAVLWLNQLQGRIQDQNESPAEFTSRYDRAVTAREDARSKLEIQHSLNEDLGAQNKELKTRAASLAAELETAQKSLARSEKEAERVPKLRDQIAVLEKSNEGQKQRLDELQPWLESEDGQKAVGVQRDLTLTRYAAFTGWGCSVLLGLALVASFFYPKPSTDGPDAPPDEVDRPPHRIV
jgi:hypothetical protein